MLPSTTYHIYNHANGGDNLFREEENYHYFLRKWKQHIHPVADTLAYCLMPNHFHFMVTVKVRELLVKAMVKRRKFNYNQDLEGFSPKSTIDEIINYINRLSINGESLRGLDDILSSYVIQQFSNLFNGYTKAINKRYRRYGSLFAPRFRRKEVNSGEYRLQLLAYIHCNPVLHGFESNLQNWEYSSYNDLIENGNWKRHFSEDFTSKEDFETFHCDYLDHKRNDDGHNDHL